MESIEKDLKYCPECRDEYRAEIISCAVCGIELITGKQLLSSGRSEKTKKVALAEIGEHDTLTVLQVGGIQEMKKLKKGLSTIGIPSIMAKSDNCGGGCCGPEIQLHIRVQDAAEAHSFLLSEHQRDTGLLEEYQHENQQDHQNLAEAVFDPQAATVQCPACLSKFVPESSVCPDCGLQFL